jgi:hypothetical protein
LREKEVSSIMLRRKREKVTRAKIPERHRHSHQRRRREGVEEKKGRSRRNEEKKTAEEWSRTRNEHGRGQP